jgi:multiple sugar transport system ATP-binding protein
MAFGLKLRKYPKEEISKRVAEAAEILRINHLLNRKPKALSGGERQRVAVGRAIVRHPKAFLFDEPLSNLDAKLRVQMRTEIKKLHKGLQATMIYVTHDQTEAMTMGDIIVVLNEGVIQQIADPLTLYQKPANQFVAGFIGSPPMNFIAGNIIENRNLFFQSDSFSIKVDASMITPLEQYGKNQVVFGIRPEDIHIEGALFEKQPNELIHTQVDVVEPLGSETLLYLIVGKHQLVAKVNSHITSSINTNLPVAFDMKKAHFFAENSGEAII